MPESVMLAQRLAMLVEKKRHFRNPLFWGAVLLSVSMHVGAGAFVSMFCQPSGKTITPMTIELELESRGGAASGPSRHAASRHTKSRLAPTRSMEIPVTPATQAVLPTLCPNTSGVGAEQQNSDEGNALGICGQGSAITGEYVTQHFETIRDRIQSRLEYPLLARKLGWSGVVRVSFMIGPDGRVAEITVVCSCGHALLDQQVAAAIHAAEPFPCPGETVRMLLPVTYTMKHNAES